MAGRPGSVTCFCLRPRAVLTVGSRSARAARRPFVSFMPGDFVLARSRQDGRGQFESHTDRVQVAQIAPFRPTHLDGECSEHQRQVKNTSPECAAGPAQAARLVRQCARAMIEVGGGRCGAQVFRGPAKTDALLHGHSYTAHPMGCAAAVAALDLYADPGRFRPLVPCLCQLPPSPPPPSAFAHTARRASREDVPAFVLSWFALRLKDYHGSHQCTSATRGAPVL